jgi:hypothetical protein
MMVEIFDDQGLMYVVGIDRSLRRSWWKGRVAEMVGQKGNPIEGVRACPKKSRNVIKEN